MTARPPTAVRALLDGIRAGGDVQIPTSPEQLGPLIQQAATSEALDLGAYLGAQLGDPMAAIRVWARASDWIEEMREIGMERMDEVSYAWCFSHGRMHVFAPSAEYPDGAWCTAAWVRLTGDTTEAAEADKVARFGDAHFVHQLPLDMQAAVIRERATNA